MFRPAQFVGMQALEDSTSQAAARSPLLNPMAPMIAAPVQQQLHTPQQLVQQEQQLPANSQKQPAALTAIHPSGPDGTISCDVSTASSISSKARIDALIAMAVKASWPGMVIIKKLLEELEELHNMLKVKRKQQELRRQQDEARAKLATLHAGAAAPAAVSAPGKQESADKPPQPSPRGSTETIAEGFAMQEAGMSSIPIFSHRLVDLMDD